MRKDRCLQESFNAILRHDIEDVWGKNCAKTTFNIIGEKRGSGVFLCKHGPFREVDGGKDIKQPRRRRWNSSLDDIEVTFNCVCVVLFEHVFRDGTRPAESRQDGHCAFFHLRVDQKRPRRKRLCE